MSEASVIDIPAGSAPHLQMCLRFLQKCMLVFDVPSARCNCHKHACYFKAKFKDMGTATGLIVS